jgi:hypothetical protein
VQEECGGTEDYSAFKEARATQCNRAGADDHYEES